MRVPDLSTTTKAVAVGTTIPEYAFNFKCTNISNHNFEGGLISEELQQQQQQQQQQQNYYPTGTTNITVVTPPSTSLQRVLVEDWLAKNASNPSIANRGDATASLTAYESTADEFVQRALLSSSTSPSSTSSIGYWIDNGHSKSPNQNLEFHRFHTIETNTTTTPKELIHRHNNNSTNNRQMSKRSTTNVKHVGDANSTYYKSFEPNFEANSIRDLENLNMINVYNNDFYHPKKFINQRERICISDAEQQQNTDQQQLRHGVDSLNDNQDCAHEEQSNALLVEDLIVTNDDNTKGGQQKVETKYISYDNADVEDEYLTSPTSSSTISLRTSKCSYFPRGIINPNYPGFQHLAHTLSEHYISAGCGKQRERGGDSSSCSGGAPSCDSCDSDISDYEMELSSDSFEEDGPKEVATTPIIYPLNYNQNNNNNHNNNNNNNTIAQKINTMTDDKQQRQKQATAYTIEGDAYTIGALDSIERVNVCNNNIVNDDDDQISDQLKRHLLLNKSTTIKGIDDDNNMMSYKENEHCVPSEITCRMTQDENSVAIINQMTITPDILIKNNNQLQLQQHNNMVKVKKENRPDLLCGVSPQLIAENQSPHHIVCNGDPNKSEKNASSIGFGKQSQTCNYKNMRCSLEAITVNSRAFSREELSFGVTPEDIIGDFGEEVEREFGLLVSGYRRLVDSGVNSGDMVDGDYDNSSDVKKSSLLNNENFTADATLSAAIDSIDSTKYLAAFQQKHHQQSQQQQQEMTIIDCDHNDGGNDSGAIAANVVQTSEYNSSNDINTNTSIGVADGDKGQHDSNAVQTNAQEQKIYQQPPKYQRSSYDERQLPPVAIEYKRCQQPQQPQQQQHSQGRKLQNAHHVDTSETAGKAPTKPKVKSASIKKILRPKVPNVSMVTSKIGLYKSKSIALARKREEAQLNEYQQLIGDKEQILSKSRYAKMSSWAQYLKNSVNDQRRKTKHTTTELISPSALDLFDAYKVGTEIDRETLQKHFKMAKEIEKKRRNDREEIRRRLAMGTEENSNDTNAEKLYRTSTNNIQSRLSNGILHGLNGSNIYDMTGPSSDDNESHESSDSETCPKLSKIERQQQKHHQQKLHYNLERPLKLHNIRYAIKTNSSSSNNNNNNNNSNNHNKPQHATLRSSNEINHDDLVDDNNADFDDRAGDADGGAADNECDFFTKQAKLQIEARMGLAQAKDIAHMQMKIDRQNQCISPITEIVRNTLQKIGVRLTHDTRRVSRQMLTDMNIAQLQILVNSLHTHIEELNEQLVDFLMKRDDLHMEQDSMLMDIEEITRYIGASEHLAAAAEASAQQQQQQQKQKLINNKKHTK